MPIGIATSWNEMLILNILMRSNGIVLTINIMAPKQQLI